MRSMCAAVFVTFILTAAGCATVQQPAPASAGRLVIVGGGLGRDNEAVYRAMLDARQADGPLCIVPTASGGDPESTIAGAVAAFERWGGAGAARGINVSTANAQVAFDSATVHAIEDCGGFWFTGGVQSRVSTVFRPGGRNTPAYEALMARHRAGAVVGGSSAGAAIMSDPMIAAGSTSGALTHGVARIPAEADEDDDAAAVAGVAISTGLGFLPDAIVDQHFLARGRIGRLIAAVLDLEEYDLGFGIDENTALVVDGRVAHAAGASGVIVIDERSARRSGRGATDVRIHLLGAGDRYDMERRTFTAAASKTSVQASTADVSPPEDVFARWAFLELLHRFATSSLQQIVVPTAAGELRLRKGHDFAARAGAGAGVRETPAGLGITGLLLDVVRPE